MSTLHTLFSEIKGYDKDYDKSLIEKAYILASKAHQNQKRSDGQDYIIHPIEVANILSKLKADTETICAAILHDVVEDARIDLNEIREKFGDGVANLVDGVTKIEKIHFNSAEDYKAENLRKIFLASTKDVRVMMIKLADRLHNMRTLGAFSESKQRRIAQETLDIFAPIAEKLGLWKIKGELEDLSMRYLIAEEYFKLKEKINEKRTMREERTAEILDVLEKLLKAHNIDAKVTGRAKYFYSIYQKMQKKKKSFDEIHDLVALRILVNTETECYAAHELIKERFEPIPGRLKDYIKNPKPNGYQSIHTDVKTKDKILEIQIRTQDMHRQAEEGIASHWKYKGTERDKKFDQKMRWLKQIIEWKRDVKGAEFVTELKIDLFHNEIVVVTPKGDPIILPEGSTPVDFAYEIHSDVGDITSKAIVNEKSVPLEYELKSGDMVKIVTNKNTKPSRTWLNYVKTSKARSKIKQALNIRIEHDPKSNRVEEKQEASLLGLLDTDKKNVKLSKCCHPQFEDEIIGIQTKDGALSVHRKDCPNVYTVDELKHVEMEWRKADESVHQTKLRVKDRIGLIEDILNMLVECRVAPLSIHLKVKKEYIVVTLKVRPDTEGCLEEVENRLPNIEGVVEIVQ